MNRIILFVFASIISANFSFAQTSGYPAGGYKTIDELRSRKPSEHSAFQPIIRNKEEILFIGGNDYFMRTIGEGVDQKIIVKELFAVSTGDTLYLNTVVHKLATGYAKALSEGRYIVFRTGFRDKKKGRVMSAAMALGPTGFVIAIPFTVLAALSSAKSAERHLLVIDTKTGTLCLCDRNFLMTILKPFPDIEYQYSIEQEQNDEDVLLKYVKMVNAAVEEH